MRIQPTDARGNDSVKKKKKHLNNYAQQLCQRLVSVWLSFLQETKQSRLIHF